MNMKKAIILAIFAGAILAFGPAFSQEKKEVKKDAKTATSATQAPQPGKTTMQPPAMTPEKRAEQALIRISEKVKDLTPEQKKKLTDIHVASFTQADKDRELAKTDMEKFKEVSKARVIKMRDDIKGVLTDAQWKVYSAPAAKPEGAPGDKKDAPKPDAPKMDVKK